jgi:hypothetical protein
MEAQCVLWMKLNTTVLKKGVTNPNFKGFMVDSAQSNWNVVHIVYGTRDLVVNMIDKESTWFVHWNQSLDRHIKMFHCYQVLSLA